MKITLVHPLSGLVSYADNRMTLENNFISLGLCYLASELKSKEYQVSLIDARRYQNEYEILYKILEFSPDIIGFHCQCISYNFVKHMSELIKARYGNKHKICVGGIHPTLKPDDFEFADYIFCGEGEKTFTERIGNLDGDKVIQCERVEDLDNIRFPDREIYRDYKGKIQNKVVPLMEMPLVDIIIGRGCVYDCLFCQPSERKLFGKMRMRSVDNVIEELKELYSRYQFKSVFIHDDTFTWNKKWLDSFFGAVSNLDFKFKFICQGTVRDLANGDELIKKMKSAGLETIIIGFESGSQRILDFIGKKVNVEDNIGVAEILKQNGIKIWANYMLGIPTETREDIDETLKMIKEIEPEHRSPSFFTPHIGTYLYDYCIENNLILTNDYDKQHRYPNEAKIKNIDYKYIVEKMREEF